MWTPKYVQTHNLLSSKLVQPTYIISAIINMINQNILSQNIKCELCKQPILHKI